MINLQGVIEAIVKRIEFTEISKILIFLLRKFLPRDFQYKLDPFSLVFIQTIIYLLKELITYIQQNRKEIKNPSDILHEINELFVLFPPNNLKKGVPNLDTLDKVYILLRGLTDETVKSNEKDAKIFIQNLKKSKATYCELYCNYLSNIVGQF